jgi:hypothetical protein
MAKSRKRIGTGRASCCSFAELVESVCRCQAALTSMSVHCSRLMTVGSINPCYHGTSITLLAPCTGSTSNSNMEMVESRPVPLTSTYRLLMLRFVWNISIVGMVGCLITQRPIRRSTRLVKRAMARSMQTRSKAGDYYRIAEVGSIPESCY